MAKRGRPRLYASESEKMKAYRESKKAGGAVRVGFYLPSEYKELLKRFCEENHMSMSEAVCCFLDEQYSTEETDGGKGN